MTGTELKGKITYVTNALGFFSTTWMKAFRFARDIAFRARATSGPLPAPATHKSLYTRLATSKFHIHRETRTSGRQFSAILATPDKSPLRNLHT